MATYNGCQYIYEQVSSILNQLDACDELIISDDGSTDNTVAIVNSFNDARIKVYTHKSSGRPTENFQNALIRAKGEFIFLSDQDDIWIENKYDKLKELLLVYDLVVSNSIIVDENLNKLNPSFFAYHRSKKGIFRNAIKNSYFGSCMAFRSEILKYALPFPTSSEIGHDVWIGLVAEITGKVFFYNEALILYRRHSSAVTSHAISKSKRSFYKKVFGRLVMLQHVIIFYIKYKWKKA
ncbi:glycosyltransferase family 2 protein [Mucilaginibacter sp.]|uniref:glycosyltransferase family 2 protein n=1 Tax=Mucilaginibacter sp. TaxID=1882438 RepID=UPI003B00D5D4